MENENALVFVKKDTPLTTSLIIAEGTENEHRAVIQLIKRYGEQFERWGKIRFQHLKCKNPDGGRPMKVALLNEQQATFLITLLRNNEIVVAFKGELVDQFYKMRENLRSNRPQSTIEHAKIRRAGIDNGRRPVTDAIKLFVERDQPDSAGLYYGTYTKETQIKTVGISKGGRDNADGVELALQLLVEKSNANQFAEAYERGETFFNTLYKKCVPRAKQIKDMFITEGLMNGEQVPLLG